MDLTWLYMPDFDKFDAFDYVAHSPCFTTGTFCCPHKTCHLLCIGYAVSDFRYLMTQDPENCDCRPGVTPHTTPSASHSPEREKDNPVGTVRKSAQIRLIVRAGPRANLVGPDRQRPLPPLDGEGRRGTAKRSRGNRFTEKLGLGLGVCG